MNNLFIDDKAWEVKMRIVNVLRFCTPQRLAQLKAQHQKESRRIQNRHNQHNYRLTKHGKRRTKGRNDVASFLLYALKNKHTLCPLCNRSFLTSIMQVDHITPISRNGSNNAYNLRMLCKSCNSRKRDKMPDGLLNFDKQECHTKQQDRYTIIHRSSTRAYHLHKPRPTVMPV